MAARGIRNHNPGNLRRSKDPWQGLAEKQTDKAFLVFAEAKWGIRALARTLIVYQDKHRCGTVEKIIRRWAPPNENDTDAYVESVAQAVGITPTAPIDVHDYAAMRPLVEGIIRHENGEQPYTDAQIDAGLVLAGIEPPAKPLAQTRTVRGGQVAAGGVAVSAAASAADFVADHSQDLWDTLSPWLPYLKGASIGFLALASVGIGYMVWARYDDRRKGLR